MKVVPSALTFTVSASLPTVPISARPTVPVCSMTEALSPEVALLIFSRWPAPPWLNNEAGEATDSRLVASGVADTPSWANTAGFSAADDQLVPL